MVQEHGRVPKGIVDRLMMMEILVSSTKFGTRVCDRAVPEGEIVD
jgi:hypothetical protein